MSNVDIICVLCRFSKENFAKVVSFIEDEVRFLDGRGSPLTPNQQVALCLSYLSSGAFQYVAGSMMGASKSASFNTVHRVLNAFDSKADQIIALPTTQEMRHSADEMEAKFTIPGMALGVDGTFVTLLRQPNKSDLPSGQVGQDYLCGKQVFHGRTFRVKWAWTV